MDDFGFKSDRRQLCKADSEKPFGVYQKQKLLQLGAVLYRIADRTDAGNLPSLAELVPVAGLYV